MDDEELFLNYIRNMGIKTGQHDQKVDERTVVDSKERALFLKAMSEEEYQEIATEKMELKPSVVRRIKLPKNQTVPVQDTLDLHGIRAEAAVQALSQFIQQGCSSAFDTVLVITGKGKNSPSGSVLRPIVESWIRKEGDQVIRAYGYAPRFQGGDGAFVIYLKKTCRKIR